MSLSDKPKLLCDANVPHKLSKLLAEEGFDLIIPPQHAEDSEVAQLANLENRVMITFDRHFGNINLFPPEKYSGIILIRISPPLISTLFSSLIKLLTSVKYSEFKGKLYTLSLSGYKIFPKSKEN